MNRRDPQKARRIGKLGLLATLVFVTREASADPIEAHATAGAAHAIGAPQGEELGGGGGGDVTLAVPLTRAFAVEGSVAGVVLSKGSAPADPSIAPRSTGGAIVERLGFRVRPFASRVAGLWIDGTGGLAETGSLARPAFGGRIGYDARVGNGRFELGPFAEYMQIVQPNDTLRPEDARVVMVGIRVGWGAEEKKPPPSVEPPPVAKIPPPPPPIAIEPPPPPPPDRDADSIVDAEDACPDVPGVRTQDAATNGCPPEPIRVAGDKLELDEVIHFDTDSPRVHEMSLSLVRKVAQFIAAHPAVREITIEGHADAVGSDAHNLRLSRKRAESVRQLLVHYGIRGTRVHAEAFGRSRLLVPTMKAEEANRRVEFWVTQADAADSKGKQ